MENKLGATLKKLRENAKMTAKDVSSRLSEMGFEVSDKTLYGYEKGIRMPNADIFVALCQIFSCKNILETFGDIGIDYSIPDDQEWKLIDTYRKLDPFGQETVTYILDREFKRTLQIREAGKHSVRPSSSRVYPYVHKIACAGSGFYFDDIPTDTIELPFVPGADFVIGVNGDSMEPDYHDGELLYIEKIENLQHGEIGIFTIGNECYVKEYGPNGLISHNHDYPDIPGNEEIRLIGKVIEKVEK